jgi:SAM-dependent methyltransferase
MTISAPAPEIEAAEAYESLHVPALFQQWAPRVLRAAQFQAGERLLDIACGTGVLAREALATAGKQGAVAGIDPGAGMLAVAQRLAPEVDWRQGVAEALPFSNGFFDVIVSQFGLMFFSDRRQAIHEMQRVAAPGGRLAVAVWESLERSTAYPELVDLLQRVAGDEAANALRAPFVLGDTTELSALFAGAGCRDVTIATHPGTAQFPSVKSMVEADLRGWLPVMGVHLPEDMIAHLLQEAENVLQPFRTPAGTIEFSASAHIVIAGAART